MKQEARPEIFWKLQKENVRIEREKTMKDLQTQIAGLAMASAEKIVGDKEQNIYDQFLGEVGGTDEDTDK